MTEERRNQLNRMTKKELVDLIDVMESRLKQPVFTFYGKKVVWQDYGGCDTCVLRDNCSNRRRPSGAAYHDEDGRPCNGFGILTSGSMLFYKSGGRFSRPS